MFRHTNNSAIDGEEYKYLEGILEIGTTVSVAPDGGLVINGNMSIDYFKAKSFPHKINELNGNFRVHSGVTVNSVKGFNLPEMITGDIIIESPYIETFHGFPSTVIGSVRISYNSQLVDFEGFPKVITDDYIWSNVKGANYGGRGKIKNVDVLFDCEVGGKVNFTNIETANTELELFIKMQNL